MATKKAAVGKAVKGSVYSVTVVADIQAGFVSVEAGKGKWRHALLALQKAGARREELFTAETLAGFPGWPAIGQGLSKARLSGQYKDHPVFKAMNAFSNYVYSNTTGSEAGGTGRPVNGRILLEKPVKTPKAPPTGGDKRTGKPIDVTKGLALPKLIKEVSAAIEREPNKEKQMAALQQLDLTLSALKIKLLS